MLCGFHVIFSTYGFWLPNDPRGSWSDWVRKWELRAFGPAAKVATRKSVATAPHDAAARRAAKSALRFPEVSLTGTQARSAAVGMGNAVAEAEYDVFACSILPQHVHLVLGRHDRPIERIVAHIKARATRQMKADDLHPLVGHREVDGTIPSPWGRGCWKVYIYSDRHMRDAIRYVQENPLKDGKRPQSWSFVKHISFDRPR